MKKAVKDILDRPENDLLQHVGVKYTKEEGLAVVAMDNEVKKGMGIRYPCHVTKFKDTKDKFSISMGGNLWGIGRPGLALLFNHAIEAKDANAEAFVGLYREKPVVFISMTKDIRQWDHIRWRYLHKTKPNLSPCQVFAAIVCAVRAPSAQCSACSLSAVPSPSTALSFHCP